MVYRVYVEKKPGLRFEAVALRDELRELLGVNNLSDLRLLNRYDVADISEDLFTACLPTVFAEPQVDDYFTELPPADYIFAVEYLPGQFDQRADSAAQCIQLISQQERPLIRTARVYVLSGHLSGNDFAAIKDYLINPVESREALLEPYQTLKDDYPCPQPVAVLEGFIDSDAQRLQLYRQEYALAMDEADLLCCRDYFRAERRDPTISELRVLDTYWSDHCRHTTFTTIIDEMEILDEDVAVAYRRFLRTRSELGREERPITLMDMATGAARYLKAIGRLPRLDESPEVNACTVKIKARIDGQDEDWLLLFKNETHNHPTEIEPFGGAATCLGGAIRDPLSGRAYVYQAMRLTGAADPTRPFSETLPGKLPQRQITTKAAAGYSSYGNQVGLATGLVDELYHPGYAAKRMEIGAVIGAAPAANVRRAVPEPGDMVILLGGRTGRDGCGGATGSSKAHDLRSIETCGAEVQKGNAPEERKLQRLFRNAEVTRLIKRCNDFGAGGVAVAIGELAPGVHINLDAVPKKYDGLDGTELAISESQERMAVVVAADDAPRLIALAAKENLEAAVVAEVTVAQRLVMEWRGEKIIDIDRAFLDTNGSEKHTRIKIEAGSVKETPQPKDFKEAYFQVAADLNCCSRRGLVERFDSTIGAGSVLLPFGGRRQLTPAQVMAAKLPLIEGETDTCSVMSWGFDPELSEQNPYRGAYLAVLSSVQKLVAAGAPLDDCYLSFQEYFGKPGNTPSRWGLPAAALLGAFAAQLDLSLAAIGGKDSMSGSFEQLDVPPTLVSFAVTLAEAGRIISPELKKSGSRLVLLQAELKENGLPETNSMLDMLSRVRELIAQGRVLAAYVPGAGGIAAAVLKMCLGNDLGVRFDPELDLQRLFGPCPAAFILELAADEDIGLLLGYTTEALLISGCDSELPLAELSRAYDARLESVFPTTVSLVGDPQPAYNYAADGWPSSAVKTAKPCFLLPVFPGTNCEYDTARAIERAGGRAEIMVLNNMSAADVACSVEQFAAALARAQALVLPGGFSGGDEPDGSGKLITAFLRNPEIKERLEELLAQRDGLILGICNGFQALIKMGLVPFGRIVEPSACNPTLSFNTIGRHQSRLVRVRIASNLSPWLAKTRPGAIYTVPISHGEGRFLCRPELLAQLVSQGQIAGQYVDDKGNPSMDVLYNPSGSTAAVEAITSPDGRVLGKMGHTERTGKNLYRNVPGNFDLPLFESAVAYFRG
ncbi:MAG: phosphoribosylformylglycinamidine synthase [Clostridia bacterium]|nr:phosphoribosylformylglycinamidine synthase [Clostridia bacterium]